MINLDELYNEVEERNGLIRAPAESREFINSHCDAVCLAFLQEILKQAAAKPSSTDPAESLFNEIYSVMARLEKRIHFYVSVREMENQENR